MAGVFPRRKPRPFHRELASVPRSGIFNGRDALRSLNQGKVSEEFSNEMIFQPQAASVTSLLEEHGVTTA